MKCMKSGLSITIVLTFLAPFTASPQSLFDNFNGTSVNSSLWNVALPFSQSQVIESGGYLTTTGRGTLETVQGFNSPYTISGSVTLNNADEHFSTVLRTDLSVWPPDAQYHELNGINVVFSADGDQISIQQFTPGQQNPIFLALTSYSFVVGQPYDFTITDDETDITLSIDGTELLSGTSTYAAGDQIAFESREFSTTSSRLDFVQISPVPEPSSVVLTGVGFGLILIFRKWKQIVT
jgi:hypothetical protein